MQGKAPFSIHYCLLLHWALLFLLRIVPALFQSLKIPLLRTSCSDELWMLLQATSVALMRFLSTCLPFRCWLVHAKLCTCRNLTQHTPWTHPWSWRAKLPRQQTSRSECEGNLLQCGLQMPDPRSVKGISDISNYLDSAELIKARLCLFFLSAQVLCRQRGPTSPSLGYVISASLSFRTSYWQISPLLTNEVSRAPRGTMANIILPSIDPQKTAGAHPSLCT